VRWDSPFVLAVAATIAIHVILVTAGDALVVTHPPRIKEPAPHIELVEIEPPPVLKEPPPPPPPLPTPEAAPPPVADVRPAPRPHAVAHPTPQIRAEPATPQQPAEPPAPETSGGDEVVHMDNIAPSATGVGVATGKRSTGRIGRGGTGGGTGAGAGSGAGDEAEKPMSIATIKIGAKVKGDFGYMNLGKDYPAEARALGIEGDLRVRLIVDDRGKVTARVLLNKLGHGLDELALQRAAEIEFEPAKDSNDQPVRSVVVWTFHMTIPK
jgi:TonB family protein